MAFLSLLIAADPFYGRVGIDSLTDQARMHLMFADTAEIAKAKFLCDNGDFKDICDWNSVLCQNQEVVQFTQNNLQISNAGNDIDRTSLGTLHLEYMPSSVERFLINSCPYEGTLDTAALPRGMQVLHLCAGLYTGTVDLCALPPTLKALKLTKSAFAGSISLSRLPGVLHTLSLLDNQFQGTISLDKLSPNMKRMSLAKNNFSGCISFESLSTSLVYLDLSANAFSGELDFSEIPPLLEFLFVNGNNFSGKVYFTEMKAIQLLNASDNDLQGTAVVPVYANGELVDLMGNGITAVETPGRLVHPREKRMLTNSTNARDISRLRKDLEYLKSF